MHFCRLFRDLRFMVMEGLSHALPQFLLHHSRNECSSLQCWMVAALFLGLSRLTGQLFLLFMCPCPQCSQQVPGFLWHAWQLVLTKTTVSKYGTLWILDFWYKTTDSIPLLFVAWILLSAPIWKLQFSLLFELCLIPNSCTSLLAFFLQHQPYSCGLISSITEVENKIFTIPEDCYWVLSQFSPFRVNHWNTCSPFHINFVFWTSDPIQCSSLSSSQMASDFLEMRSPNMMLHQGRLPAEESWRIVSCTSEAKGALSPVKEHSGGWG